MSYGTQQDTISITSRGTTEAAFTSVTFKASATATGKTGPAAKEETKGRIEAILKVVAAFTERAGIEKDRLRTTFAVDVWKEYNGHRHEFKGYRATYTIAFNAKNVAEATALHDALTSINGVEAETPVFNIDDSPQVVAHVFADAVKKAKITFSNQCAALNFNAESFEIVNWRFIPGHRGSGKFLSLSSEDESVEIAPGRAVLESSYMFEFKKKAAQPLNG